MPSPGFGRLCGGKRPRPSLRRWTVQDVLFTTPKGDLLCSRAQCASASAAFRSEADLSLAPQDSLVFVKDEQSRNATKRGPSGTQERHRMRSRSAGRMAQILAVCAAVQLFVPQVAAMMHMDFFDSTLVYNNLGGQGPLKADPEEMYFKNIGVLDGKEIDLRYAHALGHLTSNWRRSSISDAHLPSLAG
eukprot:scaffold1135_cov343-Prasinococcus_capsulatus_cf.AAC.12